MPEEALLDTVGQSVDTNVDQDIDSDATTDVTTDSERDSDVDQSPVISGEDGRLKLSEKARVELDRIKAENPRLAREMRAALFDRQTLLAKVPGGVKEALATIEAYEAEGGSEAVQQVKEELGLWKDLDADFQAGKPEFVNDIAAGNPEAFIQIGPVVMSKLAEVAPEVFSHEVSKVFAQDMAANDVLLNMRLLQREIAALPEANRGEVQKLWTALAAYVDRVNGLARTQPKPAQTRVTNGSGTQVDDREQRLMIREFSAERTQVKESITRREFDKNSAGRKLSSEKISTIGELYETALDRMVKSIPGHKAKVDRFLAAGDKAGYRKHMESAIRQKAPEAMAQAFRRAGVGAKQTAAAAKPAAKPGAAKPATQTTGFTRVAQKPAHNDVNWQATGSVRRTSADAGKYILRDGSKVLYQR